MAQQFEVQALGLNGIPYRIEIYNDNYGGTTVTQLDGDQQFIRFEGGQRERVGIEPIWGKEVRINVRTNEDLSPLFGLEDRDAEVRVFRTDTSSLVWQGFILTDFFQDEPRTALPGVELRAVDGLTTLEGDSFDALSGVSDSDIGEDGSFISYTDLFTGILSTLYDSPLDVEFAVEWYPDAGGQLTSSDNPLRYSGARPDVYYNSEDGAWFDQQSALEDALKSQGLEVRQSVIGGELTWLVAQPTALSASSVKTWRYAPGGTEDASSPFTRDLSLDLSSADTNRPTREFERRSESVSVTHDHTPIENLVGDDGYEEIGIGNASGWQIDNAATSYIDASILNHDNADASSVGTPDPTPSSLQQDTYVLEVRGSSQNNAVEYPISQDLGDISGIPPETALKFSHQLWHEPFEQQPSNGDQPHLYAELEIGGFYLKEFEAGVRQSVKGGSGTLPVQSLDRAIPNGTKLPLYNRTDSPPDQIPRAFITLSERADKGDTVLVGDISRDVDSKWSVAYLGFTSTAYDFALWRWTKNPNSWGRVEARAFAKDPNGQPLSGNATLRIGGAALYGETNAGSVVDRPAFVDDVTVQLTQQGNELTATTKEGSVSENGKSRDLSVLLSSGPTSLNARRIKGVGPSSDYEPTNWGIGAGGGSLSLAGLHARERLRYLREHLERQQLTVYARDKSPVVTGEEIVQFDGKTWRIAEFSSDPASGEIGLTLIQHADAGTTDLSIATVRDTEDGGTSGGGGGTAPAVGGGGGVSDWDDLTGELSGPVPFDATDDDGNPTSRSLQFLNVTPQVDVTSDPANGIALEIKDQTNGNRLGTLTTDGRWETRADQEAFADGSFGSGSSTNSLLQVEDAGTVLTTDAASIDFTGSGVNVSVNGDDVTVEVSGGSGSDIDIEDNQSVVVGGATGLSFEGSGVDSVNNDGDGTATVNISKGSSTEIQEGGTAQVSDVTVLDFIGSDFNVDNPNSGEAEVGLQDDTVTVAGNAVSLGGTTGIAHGDLSSIGSSDHHAKTTSAADLTDVSADSVTDAHHTRPSAGDGLSEYANILFVNESQVDHDSLNQYVGSEHVDHSAVTISAGTALSGGGDLTASRTLNVAGPFTGIPFKNSGDNLEWQADANNDLILENTTDSQTLLKVDQDTGTVFAAGDVVAFGLSGGGGTGSTSGLQADAPLTLDTSTDPDTIGLSIGTGLTVTNGSLEADGSVGVSSVFGRTGDVTASSGDYSASQISGFDSAARSAINNDADHGSTASHNYFSGNYSDLSGTPSIAYNSTIAADSFTSTEVSNLRSGQLDDGTTPWTSNNYFDGSDAVSAIENHNPLTLNSKVRIGGAPDITSTPVDDLVVQRGMYAHDPSDTGDSYIGFAQNGSWHARFRGDRGFVNLVGNNQSATLQVNGNEVWHDGNADSKAVDAINNDADHGSTASHNYTTSASRLSDVSPDSDPDAHHAVFEPADYNPVSDVESHGSALAIDITGDADTLDGVEGSNYARTDINETVTGSYDFNSPTLIQSQNFGTPSFFLFKGDADQNGEDQYFGFANFGTGGNNQLRVGTSSDRSSGLDKVTAVFNQGGNAGFGGETAPSYAVDVIGTGNFSGDLYASGNVGIGTTSPEESLSTTGAIYANQGNGHGTILRGGRPSWNNQDIIRTNFDSNVGGDYLELNVPGNHTDDQTFRIIKNGRVGIGTTSPSYSLEVSGDARATGEVEAFLGSDRRLKKHLDPLDSALDKVDTLTGYNFDWQDNDSVMPHKRGNTDVGVIAQEVEQVLPNAVKEFTDGHSEGYKSVSYNKLVPLLIEAIKDLRSQINQLQ